MSGARTPVRPTARGAGKQTVTISFAGYNRAWAAWIADRLHRRGLRAVLLRWDSPAEVPLTDLLHDLALAEGRVLLLLSEWYFQLGPRTHEEWNRALREVVAPEPSRFAAVTITPSALPSATAVLAPADITNMDADEAERRILDRLDLPYSPLPPDREGARQGPRFPAAMPDVWGGVPRRNTRFTGRETQLGEMHRRLTGSEPGAGVLTLHGMSGVGKTQLAAEYVYRFNSEYDMVWWVRSDTRANYRRQLAELAPRLGLATGNEYGERIRAVRDALRRGEPYARWLLVLDGADDPELIWDQVPTGPGHILITSRNPEWGEHNAKLMEVPVYQREESVAFLRRRAPRLVEAEADRLAGALEDLPLLLDQTAGWLNDSDLSVEQYIDLLESGTGIDEDIVKVSADFPVAFQTAWSILLNKLRDTVPDSVDLLRLCAFFAPGSVPVRLLKDMPHEELPEQIAGLLNDPIRWNRAINQLRQYSVVRLESHDMVEEAATTGESLYLHRMVHQIVRTDMPDTDRAEFVDVVRTALAAADPGRPTDTRNWERYAELVPHLSYADVLRSTDRAVQRLVLNCLRYMYFTGEYSAGIDLGERALRAWQELLGESHTQVWELTHHYTNLLRRVGDYTATEAITRSAVNHLRAERGPMDLEHLRAASGLAADLRGLGRYDEALWISQSVAAGYVELFGEQDSRSLSAQNNVAASLRLLGRYAESARLDEQTLDSRRKLLLPRHPWALYSEYALATDLRLLGRYQDAESAQSRNVREQRAVMGPDNPQTLEAEYNLALCQYRLGEREKASDLLGHTLQRAERVLGETDPLTLQFATAYACVARERPGGIDEARELNESVVARYELMLGPDHPFVVGVRSNQALILRNVGEREQAHALIEQVLADMARAVGESHPWTLGCALNATALRNLVGDTEAAEELSRQTADRATRTLGRTHPLTLSARIAHAADLRGLRDLQQADKVEKAALSDLATTLGARHAHTMSARSRNRPYWDFEVQPT